MAGRRARTHGLGVAQHAGGAGGARGRARLGRRQRAPKPCGALLGRRARRRRVAAAAAPRVLPSPAGRPPGRARHARRRHRRHLAPRGGRLLLLRRQPLSGVCLRGGPARAGGGARRRGRPPAAGLPLRRRGRPAQRRRGRIVRGSGGLGGPRALPARAGRPPRRRPLVLLLRGRGLGCARRQRGGRVRTAPRRRRLLQLRRLVQLRRRKRAPRAARQAVRGGGRAPGHARLRRAPRALVLVGGRGVAGVGRGCGGGRRPRRRRRRARRRCARRGGRAARARTRHLPAVIAAGGLPVCRCRAARLPALCPGSRGLCLARLAARAGVGAATARRGRQQRRDGYRHGARLDEAAACARRLRGRALAWTGRWRLGGRGAGGRPATPMTCDFTPGAAATSCMTAAYAPAEHATDHQMHGDPQPFWKTRLVAVAARTPCGSSGCAAGAAAPRAPGAPPRRAGVGGTTCRRGSEHGRACGVAGAPLPLGVSRPARTRGPSSSESGK